MWTLWDLLGIVTGILPLFYSLFNLSYYVHFFYPLLRKAVGRVRIGLGGMFGGKSVTNMCRGCERTVTSLWGLSYLFMSFTALGGLSAGWEIGLGQVCEESLESLWGYVCSHQLSSIVSSEI